MQHTANICRILVFCMLCIAGLLPFGRWVATGNGQSTGQPEAQPKPDPERAFAMLKIYDGTGSPLRTPHENWQGAQQRVAQDAAWQQWLAAQRAEVDNWMAKRRDRVEWVAGWWHDFVSPQDGSPLIFTPEEPGAAPLSSQSDPQVPVTPRIKGGWVYIFRNTHAQRMIDAARLYRLTHERRYAEWVTAQLDFYAEHFMEWPLRQARNGSSARLWGQSLDEAVGVVRYITAARLLGDYVTPDRKQRWFDRFFKPETDMLQGTFQRIHNIACWQRSAVGHVALYYNDPVLWHRAVEAPFGIRNQIAAGVTSDYLWFEQSLGYNTYVVQALLPFFTYAALQGRIAELRQEMAIVQNLTLAPIFMRFPNGSLPNPADAIGAQPRAPDANLLAAVYRLFPTTVGQQHAATLRHWDTLIDPPTASTTAPVLPAPASRNLEASRMAILRQGKWQVFFHYGQLTASHAQAEALHYEAHYDATDITHDSGTVRYGAPLHNNYYRTGLAHNVPLLDGEGQAGWHPGRLLTFDAEASVVAAEQPEYRPGFTAQRSLQITGERLIDRVQLRRHAEGKPARKIGLVLHLQGKIRLPAAFVPDTRFASDDYPAAFRYWTETRIATFTETASLVVEFPQQPMRLTLRLPGRSTVTYGTAPDRQAGRRDALYVEAVDATAQGAELVEFTTILEPAH